MILTLFSKGSASELVLPERITGRYMLTAKHADGTADVMAVEAEDGKWYLKSNQQAFLKNQNGVVTKQLIEPFQTYTIRQSKEPAALLYSEPLTADRYEFTKHLTAAPVIRIGRSQEMHVCFQNRLVSNHHCTIEYTDRGAIVRDENSANGTYVNGERIKEAALSVGDVIYIMGLKIIYNGRMLSLNNPHTSVLLGRDAFEPFAAEKPALSAEEELEDFRAAEEPDDLFYRSPRFRRTVTRTSIKIDPPPQQSDMEGTPLMLMLGPSITMGMASLFTGLLTLQNVMKSDGDIMMAMPTLVMSLSMLLGTILWPIVTKRYEDKKRVEREKIRQEKYRQYLLDMKEVIEEECRRQSEIVRENNVPLQACIRRIQDRERSLWERMPGQDDFLQLRVGTGDLPLDADLKYQERRFMLEEDDLQEELYCLVEAPRILKDVPVSLSLISEPVIGVIGERSSVTAFIKGLIFQLTALHSYDEVKLVFIYDKNEEHMWQFVRWLPHVWDEGKTVRFIAVDAGEVKELSAFFEKEIAERAGLTDEELQDAAPHYVVFSMSKMLGAKAKMLQLLLKEKRQLRFSVVALYGELRHLPKECYTVVELHQTQSRIYDRDDVSGAFIAFTADTWDRSDEEELAIQLANIELDTARDAYVLPEMLTFLEMFGVRKVEHLNALTRWKENNPTLSMETPIGVDTGGETFKLDLHEKYHGPHGLIAGMTGSGKSEFIMTFILSLAVNYHPDEVAFILIDYKGGGMANAFLQLPHLAGTITNLDGAAVNRSLVSIQSELKRRQAIFSHTSKRVNESNIDIYKYQKLYREGLVTEPLQHLFIISDEFAELKTQQPEFMEQLVSAARIGRSLGVHLILATQKPSGVVDDQIWSNSKFRISLKVQEKADSMDVIKRPDAAELSTTGRFYLQVGFNEIFVLGQSAWAGAPIPADRQEKCRDEGIAVIDNLGRVLKSAKLDRGSGQSQKAPKQIDEITSYLASLAIQESIRVRQLWLEPIPALIYMDELKRKYSYAAGRYELQPIIGEYDDPANQRQLLLTLPITVEGNTVVYGGAGSGKTTFVTTFLYSLMEEHTPEEVNFYLLDFSAETLVWFQDAPHVGDVMLSHEQEKISNLFKMLGSEVERRKKILASYGGDFRAYHRTAQESLPSIVVVIHNYAVFADMYEDQQEAVAFLTREGTKYGIYFVVTAVNTNALRYTLLQNFKQMYVLQLNDKSEYAGVLGNVDGVYPAKYKGRGIFKTEQTYEFQVAHITKDATDMYSFITAYCKEQRQRHITAAQRVPVLPERVDADFLRDEIGKGLSMVPVGVDKATLQTAHIDLTKSFVNLVLSNNSDQCTSFLQGAAEVIAAGDREVIVIDPNGSFSPADGYRHVSSAGELESIIVEMFQTLVHRNNSTKEAIEAGMEPPVFGDIVCIIDSFADLQAHISADAKDKLAVFLDKGDSLRVTMILSDSADRISSVSYEAWFKKQASLSDGIWIGSGITDQYVLKAGKITNDMYREIPDGFGYVLDRGKVRLVKLLTAAVSKEAVHYG